MSAEIRHAGLTADERSEIRSTVLETRELIEDDFFRQLQRYGIYEDERVDLDHLDHLDTGDKEIRKTVDAALDRELEATEGDYHRSIQNFVREATKTELNRLVALKAIEVRGLVSETLTERPEYGHRSEMLRAVDEVASELTEQPDGGMGIALSLAFTELSDEIGLIFEESEHTVIDVDFAVRDDVIDALNDIDQTVWRSDEAMGWVYQYFGEKERDEIDERIDEENYKVQDTDVATKTQLFTPRYIVEWMLDNSLGRLWLEMHGDTTCINTEDNCFYLAPLEDSMIDRQPKDVRDIKVLDPACGSGHILFYAFDVLYEMYLEQGDVPEKYIPQEILRHNLYGIDIDPGAAQLAALSLYVKAKSEEPAVELEQINVVSADAVLVNGEKKAEVLERADSDIVRSVLEEVWQSFEHIREWGSLIRIEERIGEIIEEELEDVRSTGQAQFIDGGLAKQSSVASFSGEEESWEQVKARLLDQVRELAEEALEHDEPIEEMFADEVEKSVRILEVLMQDFDVVITNPPYLDTSKMDDGLKQYTKDNFIGSRDLYSSFIERCTELTEFGGYTATVTPENFMFLYSYRGMRPKLLSKVSIVEAAHLSGYSFSMKDRPFTVAMVMKRGDYETKSRFYRMTHEQDNYSSFEDKIRGLRTITQTHRTEEAHPDTYVVDQDSFKEIGRTPFIYWFGNGILNIFKNNPTMQDVATVRHGLRTGDDERFVRKFWEIKPEQIGEEYFCFQKSGTNEPFYDIPEDFVFWYNNGKDIIEHNGSDTSNKDYFFNPGLTYRDFGKYLVARLKPDSRVYGHTSHFIESDNIEHTVLIGLLCSSLYRFIMNGLNPGLHFGTGDGKRLPIKQSIDNKKKIDELVSKGISYRKCHSELIEYVSDFDSKKLEKMVTPSIKDFIYNIDMLNSDVRFIEGLIDELVFDEYQIQDEMRLQIQENLPKSLAKYPHISNAGELNTSEYQFRSEVRTKEIPTDEYNQLVTKIDETKELELRKISEKLEVSPYTVSKIRHDHDLYTGDEKKETAGRLLSYYLGCAMGRWAIKGLEPDDNGIIPIGSDFEDNIMSYVRDCIKLTYGEEELYDKEREIEDMLNKGIEAWLRDTFFRYHHCKEYRRRGQRIPIYWQLESDGGAFSCFIYYHSIDEETFPRLRGQYIDQKIDTLQNRLDAIDAELDRSDGDRARELRSDRDEVQTDIDDIREFRERVDSLIDEGFAPDFEAGIWENIQKVDEHDLLAVPLDKL